MGNMEDKEIEAAEQENLKEKLAGIGQKIIGEAELIGGILSADPITAGEGEFNLEVGELRQEVAEELEKTDSQDENNPND